MTSTIQILTTSAAFLLLQAPFTRALAQTSGSAPAHNVSSPAARATRSPFAVATQSPMAAATTTAYRAATPMAAAQPVARTIPSPGAAASPVNATAIQPKAGLQSAALTGPTSNVEDTAEGQRLYLNSIDGERDNSYNWSIHVFKSSHRLEVYYKGHLFRVYHAVFGRSRWAGGKEWEGDTRTPEGSYLIIAKHPSTRFRWFLKLNYPNGLDEEQFVALKAAHEIPRRSRMGGQVGIHGTDDERLNLDNVNWTLGCISVDNDDIAEMATLLPVGTLVVIKP